MFRPCWWWPISNGRGEENAVSVVLIRGTQGKSQSTVSVEQTKKKKKGEEWCVARGNKGKRKEERGKVDHGQEEERERERERERCE
jgi:hypothetical protein